VSANVRIRLVKNIPIGRGLGGGSADAAVTFIGLQRIFKKLLDRDQVLEALRGLGSDVPFFAVGGQAAAFGRGDEVVGLDEFSDSWLVLVDPGLDISTHEAYSWLTVYGKSPSIEGFHREEVPGCESDQPRNDFEGPVFERFPELSEIKASLQDLGAYRASLSGSGSTVYGQFQMVSEAVRAGSALSARFRVKVTKPLPRWEYFQRMVQE
jgi:4-diphosphocytidyl-2-C-methyl-D-erythritol kinase